jgi:hypothetical protein
MIVANNRKAKRYVLPLVPTQSVETRLGKSPTRNTALHRQIFATICVLVFCSASAAETPPELRIGRANHAFDHLGDIGGQANAAAASGATIIYTAGLGEAGYHGLPPKVQFKKLCVNVSDYNRQARVNGIKLCIGYLCATSIVKLDTFDKNWTPEFRAQFKTRPAEWRQQDRHGKPLASWYGGDYQPACMNNPDWRAYQRATVRYTLETGHDGVFFDNPTVHPQGCYCPHCMKAFEDYVVNHAPKPFGFEAGDLEGARKTADSAREYFLEFRSTIARDFLEDMRKYARTINPRVLITCNNSLNTPGVLYSQCRMYGYNIEEMSKVEDFVVVEDMNSQPRTEANGQVFEYGPTYKQLHAISHGKPVVAVTIANSDYHTAPNLMRLAMAEAAANNASYLSWPTWPESQRKRMIDAVRPQADFLRNNENLLNGALMRTDVVLYLPFLRWLKTDQCAASALAETLTRENIQYRVVDEQGLRDEATRNRRSMLLIESRLVIAPNEPAVEEFAKHGRILVASDQPKWLQSLRDTSWLNSIRIKGSPLVRAVVHDQPQRTIIHIYNLNVRRISSFEDKVTPATKLVLLFYAPFKVGKLTMHTADGKEPVPLKFERDPNQEAINKYVLYTADVPRLDISALIVAEP